MRGFFDFYLFFEARAEILQRFCWFFGWFEDTKRIFRNWLTISNGVRRSMKLHLNLFFIDIIWFSEHKKYDNFL